MDISEMMKSDREKAAEVLFTWRSQLGWQVQPKGLHAANSRLNLGLGLGIGIALLAALFAAVQLVA